MRSRRDGVSRAPCLRYTHQRVPARGSVLSTVLPRLDIGRLVGRHAHPGQVSPTRLHFRLCCGMSIASIPGALAGSAPRISRASCSCLWLTVPSSRLRRGLSPPITRPCRAHLRSPFRLPPADRALHRGGPFQLAAKVPLLLAITRWQRQTGKRRPPGLRSKSPLGAVSRRGCLPRRALLQEDRGDNPSDPVGRDSADVLCRRGAQEADRPALRAGRQDVRRTLERTPFSGSMKEMVHAIHTCMRNLVAPF